MQSFSITQALSFGFRMFIRNFWLILGLSLAAFAAEFVATKLSDMVVKRSGLAQCLPFQETTQSVIVEEQGDIIMTTTKKVTEFYGGVGECFTKENMMPMLLVLLIHLLSIIFIFVLLMGWNQVALDFYDKGTSHFNRIFATFPLFVSYLVAAILYSLVTSLGMFLLIIPGIIWGIKYSFFDLAIVDTHCGPVEALRKSAELTYGHKWQLFFFIIICTLILMVSVVTLIGPFILYYVFFLSRAYIYRTLQGKKSHA
jgi:uncharacterized membrane protein